jgi:hypothetical protein
MTNIISKAYANKLLRCRSDKAPGIGMQVSTSEYGKILSYFSSIRDDLEEGAYLLADSLVVVGKMCDLIIYCTVVTLLFF